MAVTIGAERIDMVRKKADEWARQLVDLGPRNSVLYFKNTKTASLDLTNADRDALAALLSGKPTRLSTLISDEESHRAACQQVRSCARRIAAFEEEQGIQVGKIAQGLINVPAPKRRPGAALVRPLRAPLLLRTIHIAARSLAQNDFVLSLDGDTELNPVLRHALESILTRMRGLLQRQVTLRWHYRSRDERLISFANHFVYGDDLVTFPGAFKDTPVTLDVVDSVASPGQDGSAPEEIRQVVRRVIEHIEQRPHESLGVITMGQKHMDRVEREINLAARDRPDLQEFLNPDNALDQRFFVKNLERVQGDERDAIILTIGVAKRADGRVARTGFGPLNSEDGRRRLNVAVTRAKRRMTVVSSFGPEDLAPSDDETGTELLRRYLDFAHNDGDLGRVGATQPLPPNGFERDVEAALAERGIPVHAQWGFSDYRIDFALAHRDHSGRMVLAVECDGDSYHRAYNTRDRDRLRQSHLENLGWRFHRVWASAWFADRAGETDRIASVWEKAMIDADREIEPEVVAASQATEVPGVQRGPRPDVPPGLKSTEYTDAQLIAVCRWLLTDRLQLDRIDRVDEALHELDFKRRGSRIVPKLHHAMEIAQQQADRNEEQQ